jgi:D-arabinose 1-dehydrogenase-like Zn-dependent alcohol dehydrogenase
MCATDLELIDGTIDPAYVRYPLVLGHEWVGALEGDSEVGPDGAHVVVEGIIPCGICDECQRGDTNLCTTYDEIGFTRAGALAERVSVPSSLVHRLNDDVDLVTRCSLSRCRWCGAPSRAYLFARACGRHRGRWDDCPARRASRWSVRTRRASR